MTPLPEAVRDSVNYWNTLPFTASSPYRLIERTITERVLAPQEET